MKKNLILILLLIAGSVAQAQNIVINELVARNVFSLVNDEICNRRTQCADLIELHNTTANPINLEGYFLSDDPDNIRKWPIPAGTVIDANGFVLFFGKASFISPRSIAFTNQANFSLSSSGETLVLSDSLGNIVQQLSYPPLQNDIAYARLSDGTYSFNTPTPSAANLDTTAFENLESNLEISVPSGVYASTQTIELSHTGPGTIFYTLDGSAPTSSAIPYTGPITISSNTVLKAIVIENANRFSLIENRSYIIGASHTLPVILLTSDNSTRTSLNKQVINGRVEFTFIETDGSTVINQYANFRASGRTSRITPQINGKVEASKLYGDNDFDHKMYPYKDLDEFKGFLFRNASQDWGFTHMRDAFVSRLVGQDNLFDVPFEGYRPAVIYVNAEYEGVIDIKEDDDSNYVQHNYGLDEDEFESGVFGNLIPLERLIGALPSNREAVNSVINFNGFINIRILRDYTDLGEYGFRPWEDLTGKTGQRFHYFVHDYDTILGTGGGPPVIVSDPMRVERLLPPEMAGIPEYRAEALQFIAATLNHIYHPDRTLGILNEMVAAIESEIPAHSLVNVRLITEQFNRFRTAPFTNFTEWQENVAILRTNIQNRIDADIFNRMQAAYSLDAPIEVSYNSSNINQGFVRVHGVKIQAENASGTYFSNLPLKLSAKALPGFRFVRWEGDASGTNPEIAPVFSANANLTAVFEPVPVATNAVVINEVQGKNDTTVADENGEFDDWIEMYNPTDTPINLAGLYFSDNLSEPLKWQIPNTNASKTTVPANGYLLLWADNDLDQGENHLGFKLKGSDQVVVTYADGLTEKQRIVFEDIDTDISYGASSDGAPNFISFSIPTPNASNTGVVLSINEVVPENSNNAVFIAPNPVSTVTNITGITANTSWQLYNVAGNVVLRGVGHQVNLQNLASGLYFMTITNSPKTLKVIKL